MAVKDINPKLQEVSLKGKNGYETLRDAIKKHKTNLKTITKRDALYLINKQMEGISETYGNLYLYMFYFACKEKYGNKWFDQVRENDIGTGGSEATESTAWCGCYLSFGLLWSGISSKGSASSSADSHKERSNLTITNDFSKAKSMDTLHYGTGGAGHTAFLVLEDPDKPNKYKKGYYQVGGNQSDTVNLGGPTTVYGPEVSVGTNSEYEKNISAGAFLSVLAYFVKANLKSVEERKKEINARLDSSVTIGSALEKEVAEVRKLTGEALPLTTGDKSKQKRFNDALAIITPSLIGQEEEVVVPQMTNKFKEFGFKFEEIGVGDAMKVTYGSSSIEIDLDPFTSATEQAEATKLKNWIKSKYSVKSTSNGYYLGTGNDMKPFIDRFKNLLVFEQSLLDGNLPLTQNVSKKQDASRAGSTR